MQTRTPRALAAAAALALALGACTDVPTAAPSARAPGARASLTAASGPTLIPNTVKYRDTGGKPARGRSGSAEMTATAMLARNGITTLQLEARHVTHGWRYGDITRAQVQAADRTGKHKFTRNLNESDPGFNESYQLGASARLPGLASGDRLQVQAHVEGLDPNRVDVVTVDETVKRLPDLRVSVSAPAQVQSNTWVNILAVVSENNGDVGTYAACELYVGGEFVDAAEWVWVDAGDAVTCAMTWNFPVPGSYPVEVRARTWLYQEWDSADNADTATVQVNGEAPRFSTIAWFTSVPALSNWQYEPSHTCRPSGFAMT